ncbi:uncharacterized protein LOC105782122 isoform X1 [Gossypium raimondii]|uniref:uncharacterized protein LOC105782122 isoform X1 n=1 Tax=Gossypium raimondii TaxID=29730 RepID=UPI00227BBE12|nr:uncharacterized protein LOC105782122 isoform X1 [Gossypium raimondii]
MATLLAATGRRATTLSRSPALSQAASLIPRRGLAGAADHHGPPKVNCWQDPMNPSKWKEEHFVIVSLSGWGLLFFSGYKFFTKGKGKKEEELEVMWIQCFDLRTNPSFKKERRNPDRTTAGLLRSSSRAAEIKAKESFD